MSDLDRLTVMQVMAGDEEGGLEKHVEELSNALAYRLSVIVVAHPGHADRFNSCVKFIPDLTSQQKQPRYVVEAHTDYSKVCPGCCSCPGRERLLPLSQKFENWCPPNWWLRYGLKRTTLSQPF